MAISTVTQAMTQDHFLQGAANADHRSAMAAAALGDELRSVANGIATCGG
jgi:hypothetical protein